MFPMATRFSFSLVLASGLFYALFFVCFVRLDFIWCLATTTLACLYQYNRWREQRQYFVSGVWSCEAHAIHYLCEVSSLDSLKLKNNVIIIEPKNVKCYRKTMCTNNANNTHTRLRTRITFHNWNSNMFDGCTSMWQILAPTTLCHIWGIVWAKMNKCLCNNKSKKQYTEYLYIFICTLCTRTDLYRVSVYIQIVKPLNNVSYREWVRAGTRIWKR